MDNRELVHLLGKPGRYAITISTLLSLFMIIVACNHLIMSVFGAIPDHHCKQPPGYDRSNLTIPQTSDGKLDSCRVYVNYTVDTGKSIDCPNGWDYDLEDNEFTVVTEWDLVCDKRYLIGISTSLYYVGGMVVGQVLGSISDTFGRRPVLLSTSYLSVIVGVTLYFVESFEVFVMLRFIMGGLMQGVMVSFYVLAMEMSSTSKSRTCIAVLIEFMWCVGVVFLAAVAFFLKRWRQMQLVISLCPLLTLFYIWFVPESLRWLLTKKYHKRAEIVMREAAKFNKVLLPEDFNIQMKADTDKALEPVKEHTVFDMFKTSKLGARSLLLFYAAMASGMSYFGISHQASKLAGNKYLNYFINGAVDIPAVLLALWFLNRFGRRRVLSVYLLLSGIASILSGSIPKVTAAGVDIWWLSNVFAWIGKCVALAAYFTIYLCATEIFPTVIRNTGIAACTLFGRLGSILAPQIITLGDYTYTWVSILIFGVTSFIAGVLTLLLPETHHQPLPDTIEDAENIPWPWQNSKDLITQTLDYSRNGEDPL